MPAWNACQVAGGVPCLRSVVTEAWNEILVVFAVSFGLFLYLLRPHATKDTLKHRRRDKGAARTQEEQRRTCEDPHALSAASTVSRCRSTSCMASLMPLAAQSDRSPPTPATSRKAKLIGSSTSLHDADGTSYASAHKRSARHIEWSSTSSLGNHHSQPRRRCASDHDILAGLATTHRSSSPELCTSTNINGNQ